MELGVADAGPGIPKAERERVFERFQRVSGDPTRGSGLGLPIVRAVAERHRGSVVLEDAGTGTACRGLVVRVSLPAESWPALALRRTSE